MATTASIFLQQNGKNINRNGMRLILLSFEKEV
jgi:hypothetical protein